MDKNDDELFISSHLMMLLTYTIFSVILVAEIFVMDWEKWMTFLILGGVLLSWYIYFSNIGSGRMRLWVCSLLMMATFFYYGTHDTSTFDLAVVICVVMFLYTMTGIHSLVTLCQFTYYITMAYEIINLAAGGMKFDSLTLTRTLLHVAVVTMTAWISRTIINKWQEVLGHSKEEITKLNESTGRLNDFIANVSHEIRTPINTILGLCNIEISKETDSDRKNDLVAIEEAGKRIGEQISNILDFSEIDRNDVAVNYEDYMLSSVFNDLVSEIEPHRKKNIELIIDVEPSIPSVMNTDVDKLKKILWHLIINGIKFTNEGGVYVHVSSVSQVYGINLIIEVKDTGIGMDEHQLEMIYDDFYKADSGRDRTTGGLGLGMMIVHGFVKSLGGFMIIESSIGGGTSVRVSIPNRIIDPNPCMSVKDRESISLGAYLHFEKYSNPHVREFYDSMVRNIVTGMKVSMHRVDNLGSLRALVDNKKLTHLFAGPEEYNSAVEYMESLASDVLVTVVANPEELNRPTASKVRVMPKPFYCFPVVGILNSKPGDDVFEEGAVSFTGARALIVDDEPMNLIVSSGMLRRYGMIVTTCESGQEAIDLCRQNEYDVIFMDHMMPVMDGVEAMRRIRSEQTRSKIITPVIAFTANAVSSAREMFRQAGFDGFVAKPVDMVELERVLKRVLPPALVVANSNQPPKEDHSGIAPDDIFDRLKAIGVDTDTGMYYSQNDAEFYKTLLNQYVQESTAKKKTMEESLALGNLGDYAIQVHSIKSTSKMIGEMNLSEMAKELEEAAKRGDRAFVDKSHDAMLAVYERLLDAIDPDRAASKVKEDTSDFDEILEFEPEGGA
ncbi:MAG: response regulator [Lachnospiraceae bacterium]|nr:response regulator [Lachnospiraceae bacterium]